MIFIVSSIYTLQIFLLLQRKRQLHSNIPHNMKHRHTPKFALQGKSFLVGTFSPTEKWRHNEIFNSQQLPSLNFMPLQISSILLFPFTLLPSRPSIFFPYIHSLSDTLSLFFLSIILLIQTFCF